MTFVVTESCIRCKSMDCAGVCPVDCFYEGENMLVIRPEDCINCGVCVPICPHDAIMRDSDPKAAEWLPINAKFAEIWPNIVTKGTPPADAGEWKDKPNKAALFSPNPGAGS